ncbi:MAG: radical SAM protein [Nanoarchaeota archaeon]|nr:radical SAM protein [Nanoarchaeota archaeon]
MRLLLINPDYMRYSAPPLGFLSLAAYVREHCSFLDLKFLDQVPPAKIISRIRKSNPDIIGLTAVSENYYLVKFLANKIKEIFPNKILVLGGVHISTSPDSFKSSPFDFAIRGEGEISFKKLLDSLNNNKNKNRDILEFKKIKGLMFRQGEKIIDTGLSEFMPCLDNIPLPARDLLNKNYYKLPSISATEDFEPIGCIITSRGCPHNCRFCSSYAIWKQRVRFFSAERVVKEVEELYHKYRYTKIIFVDDVFTINKPRIKKIISLLKDKKLLGKIKFEVLGRADSFDEEVAKLLKQLNVISIAFGIETGSQKTLTYLKRGRLNVGDGVKAISLAKKYNIMGGGFFMLGSPYESLEDMQKTYEFIKENCSNHFAVHQTVALPGTEVWDYALKNKIIKNDFYDKPQKDFVDLRPEILLSKNVSRKDFVDMFYKIKSLHVEQNRGKFSKKIRTLRLRHLILFLNPLFILKAINLRKRFIRKFIVK